MKKYVIFSVIYAVVCYSSAFAQYPNWAVYNESNSSLPYNRVYALAIDGSDNIWIGTYGGGLAKFDGTNWTVYNTSNSGMPDNLVLSLAIDGSDNIWIGTWGGLAKFDGTNWTVYNTSNSGMTDNWVYALAIDGSDNIWIGTWLGGLAVFNEDGIVSVEEDQKLRSPNDFILSQNYPNPFNPITTIQYSLPEAGSVNLTIFDIRGQEVTTLQDVAQSAGNYEVQWNGMDHSGDPVSTGLYFARLRAGDYNKTIRMVYLK